MKSPVEYEEATIFKNIVLPTNYYLIDNKTDFTSTTKVRQICNDLRQAIGGDGYCGLVHLKNGMKFVGFYEVVDNKNMAITLSYYGNQIFLIGLNNNVEYSKTVTGA